MSGRAVFYACWRYSMYFFRVPPFVRRTLTIRTSSPADARMDTIVRRSVSLVISMGMRVQSVIDLSLLPSQSEMPDCTHNATNEAVRFPGRAARRTDRQANGDRPHHGSAPAPHASSCQGHGTLRIHTLGWPQQPLSEIREPEWAGASRHLLLLPDSCFLSFFKPAHAGNIHHGADFVLTVFAVRHCHPSCSRSAL